MTRYQKEVSYIVLLGDMGTWPASGMDVSFGSKIKASSH